MKTVFLRALEAEDKASALRAAIREPEAARGHQWFEVDPAEFAKVPGSPFAYNVSRRLREVFAQLPPFEGEDRTAKQGLVTGDDFRFVRAWWAVTPSQPNGRWFPFAKGGAFSRFYADLHLVLAYSRGDQLGIMALGRFGRGAEHYFRPGLTWPHRSASFSAAVLPKGCIFSQSGKAAFAPSEKLKSLLGLFNGAVITLLARIQSDAVRIKFEVGLVQRIPYPLGSGADATLANLGARAWSLRRNIDTHNEVSHAFTLPALLQVKGDTHAERIAALTEHTRAIDSELAAIQAAIDTRCFDLYGIDEADHRAITEEVRTGAGASDEPDTEADIEPDDEGDTVSATDATSLAAELLSWAVGVAFGRFDVRLATGERALPVEPDPFDALPVCSPAMLTGTDGLPSRRAPDGYPLAFPENGILLDDPGHPRDVIAGVRAVFDYVFAASADAWWNEVASLLDPKNHDLRAWINSSFFDYHLKHHSKGKRKAPILWQLGTQSGLYTVWLYAHRLTRDSIFQLQNDVVAPKLAHEERQLADLVGSAGDSPSAMQRKEIAARTAFVGELRALLDEVKRVTPVWNSTLDDGVVLTMAPLWRLVPQHKPWQKELKGKWDDLNAAKYDWAQTAMQLWPERVVPKCATDRSLAIAHGLEDIFWAESEGKWKPRPIPTRPIEELVRERTSPAVKAALKSLLEAPMVAGARGRARGTAAIAAGRGTY
jgi:hypothetical protein